MTLRLSLTARMLLVFPAFASVLPEGCLAPLLEQAALREGVLIVPGQSSSSSSSSSKAAFAGGTVTANNTVGEIDVGAGGLIVGPTNPPVGQGEEEGEEDGEDDGHPTKIRLPSGSWIPFDVVIGVSVGDGGSGRGKRWWGLRGGANDKEPGQQQQGGSGRRTSDVEGGEGAEVEEGAGAEAAATAAPAGSEESSGNAPAGGDSPTGGNSSNG